jgi:t-SNARE complex subunit (syntaxin)
VLEEARRAEQGPEQIPELNLMGKSRVIEYLKKLTVTMNKVQMWQAEFRSTNDKRTEDRLRDNIKVAFEQINSYITNSNLALDRMQKEVRRLKEEFHDPHERDTNIRILSLNTSLLQKKIYNLIKAFNAVQIEVKRTYEEKMKRQLQAFDPNMDDDMVKELTNDPQVASPENEQLCGRENVQRLPGPWQCDERYR